MRGAAILGMAVCAGASIPSTAASDASRLPASARTRSAATIAPLVVNGSFDHDTLGWRFYAQLPATARSGWAPHQGREGSGALQASAIPSGDTRQVLDWCTTLERLPVGHRLHVSAWVKGAKCEVSPVLTIAIMGPQGTLAFGTSQGTSSPNGDFGWTRIEASVPVPDGSTSALLSALLPGTGEVWFDDVAAAKGDTLTAAERRAQPLEKGPGLLRVHSQMEYSLRTGAAPSGFGRAGAPETPATGPRLLIALPLDYREQVPLTYEMTSTPPERIRSARVYEDRPGNRVVQVELLPLRPGEKVLLDWTSVVLVGHRSFRDVPKRALLPAQWPDEARPWLAASLCAESDDPRIRRVAASIRDTSADVVAIIAQTLTWMSDQKTEGRPMCSVFDAVQALDHSGSCLSNANLATALLRANGIPARILGGYPSWSWDPLGCHFIVEAYVPAYGWFPIEPSRFHAPVPPSDQIEVSIVPVEYEDERAVQRTSGARGLPYLSIGEFLGDPGPFLELPALDRERGGGVEVDQLERFLRDVSLADIDRALASARAAWRAWLASKPALDKDGALRTKLSAKSLSGANTPAELAKRLAAP